MEMIRNGDRFNLEEWSLSRVTMVVFGSRLTVGAIFDLNFFVQEQANFCMENKVMSLLLLVNLFWKNKVMSLLLLVNLFFTRADRGIIWHASHLISNKYSTFTKRL
jgi:hypothetical protein